MKQPKQILPSTSRGNEQRLSNLKRETKRSKNLNQNPGQSRD